MIALLFVFKIIVTGVEFNGYVILLFFSMLFNPIINIFKTEKKVIKNPVYHIVIIFVTVYISYVTIRSLVIYKNNLISWKNNFDALNKSVNYFGGRFIYILIAILLILLLSVFFKKESVKTGQNKSFIMLLIILITSVAPFLTNEIQTNMIWSLSEILFLIVIFFKKSRIILSNELQKYYLILIILSVLSINSIATVLSAVLFVQSDTYEML